MSNKKERFPLNFDAPTWSVAEAVPWIFFGDISEMPSWSKMTKFAVGYVVGEEDDCGLSTNQSTAYTALQDALRVLGVVGQEIQELASHLAGTGQPVRRTSNSR